MEVGAGGIIFVEGVIYRLPPLPPSSKFDSSMSRLLIEKNCSIDGWAGWLDWLAGWLAGWAGFS